MNLTRQQCEEVVHLYLDMDAKLGMIAKRCGMSSSTAVSTLITKLAKGYPPAQDLFAVPSHNPARAGTRIGLREGMMIKEWYDTQSEFNNPKIVEYYHKAERTKNYQRPSVRYLCELLKRSEEELKRYVFARFLKTGLVEALRCPVPEWQ